MKRLLQLTAMALVFGLLTTSCSLSPQVSATELEQVVRRDGVPFEAQAIPDQLLDRLASYRVVVVGETHFLREHRELVVELLRELHSRGFRQFLFEWTQAADWLLADFVNDGGLLPDWAPPASICGDMLAAIRDFNRTLPESERIRVHAIDVTLPDYGGGDSFLASVRTLSQVLPDPGPLSAFLQGDYDTPATQEARLKGLQGELSSGQTEIISLWGENWYDVVSELVEVELASVSVRAIRESNYDKSAILREEAINQLVDRRLQESTGGTVINVGSTHAQKKRLFGTEGVEWVGDYLAHRSPIAGGSVFVLNVAAAYVVAVPGSGYPDADLSGSKENELYRVMNQTWPDQLVFLPADDPLFLEGRVPLNTGGTIYKGSLKQHYDGFVLLPLAHRVPSSD